MGVAVALFDGSRDQELGHVLTEFPIQGLAFSTDDTLLAAASHDEPYFRRQFDRSVQPTPTKSSRKPVGGIPWPSQEPAPAALRCR